MANKSAGSILSHLYCLATQMCFLAKNHECCFVGGMMLEYLWFASEDAVLEAVELGRCCSSWTLYLLPYKVQLPISLEHITSQP